MNRTIKTTRIIYFATVLFLSVVIARSATAIPESSVNQTNDYFLRILINDTTLLKDRMGYYVEDHQYVAFVAVTKILYAEGHTVFRVPSPYSSKYTKEYKHMIGGWIASHPRAFVLISREGWRMVEEEDIFIAMERMEEADIRPVCLEAHCYVPPRMYFGVSSITQMPGIERVWEMEIPKEQRLRVVVADLDFTNAPIAQADSLEAGDALRRGLVDTKIFNVISRKDMPEILKELRIQQSGYTAVETQMQALNAQMIVVGNISSSKGVYYLNAHLVDMKTTVIEVSASEMAPSVQSLRAAAEKLAFEIAIKVLERK
ncbi:CsgG/HfaB family protein [Elusimicrobiota bacterium]